MLLLGPLFSVEPDLCYLSKKINEWGETGLGILKSNEGLLIN